MFSVSCFSQRIGWAEPPQRPNVQKIGSLHDKAALKLHRQYGAKIGKNKLITTFFRTSL